MANKFKTFLDHLGSMFKSGAEKALAVEAKLLPAEEATAAAISAINPAAGGTFEAILSSVVNVEQVATAVNASTGTGQQKLAAALPQVEQAILSNPLFKGKTVANLPLWNTAVEAIASASAELLNSFTSPSTPTPAA
ncbi:MAG TPA: hypothetical protein VMU62_02925 [Acidobacteriaceae bacterium]|nr:hypothetical protein [Acidobacteriaceae bacterium]